MLPLWRAHRLYRNWKLVFRHDCMEIVRYLSFLLLVAVTKFKMVLPNIFWINTNILKRISFSLLQNEQKYYLHLDVVSSKILLCLCRTGYVALELYCQRLIQSRSTIKSLIQAPLAVWLPFFGDWYNLLPQLYAIISKNHSKYQ